MAEEEGNCWDHCGACGSRRDEHIEGVGRIFTFCICPQFRPTGEQGEWRWVPKGMGAPAPGEKVLAYGRFPDASGPEWRIAMRGPSLLQPEKGVFWFTDAGMDFDVEYWEPLTSPPT